MKRPRTVLVRVDGSDRIGMGHVMRCLALAEGLRREGGRPVFVTKSDEPRVMDVLRGNGFDVESVPAEVDFEREARIVSDAASRYASGVFVTDLSHAGTMDAIPAFGRYLRQLKAAGLFVVMLDGGTPLDCVCLQEEVDADVIVMPYFGAQEKDYQRRVGQQFLLGPAYFLFREELLKAAAGPKDIKEKVENVLVNMGGDSYNLTLRVARALKSMNRELNVRVLLGSACPALREQDIRQVLSGKGTRYEIIRTGDHVAELMHWADLAVISSGLTKYETAFIGTPSLVIARDDYEGWKENGFEAEGLCVFLGQERDFTEETFQEAVEKIMNDVPWRRALSARGKKCFDGKGTTRILEAIPGELWR